MRYLAIAALLTACGGGGNSTEFGWWNGKNTSGSLSIATPDEYQNAISRWQKPIVIVWTAVQEDDYLVPGWRENLKAVIDATPKAIGYYAFDEPNWHGLSQADQDLVIAELPKDKIIMLSLSRPELDAGQPVNPSVNLLGANLYSSHGVTPDTAVGYLDKLASYGRPMYLNLDAMRIGKCSTVTDADQRQALALNDAIIGWGVGRDIRANVAFIWQSVIGVEDLCGASDLPLIRDYMQNLAN